MITLIIPIEDINVLNPGRNIKKSSEAPGLKTSHSPLGPNIRLIAKYAPTIDTRYIINSTIIILYFQWLRKSIHLVRLNIT